ncbi:MAG: hypothetical protein P8Y54_04735 [Xanthomonadales bacterium]
MRSCSAGAPSSREKVSGPSRPDSWDDLAFGTVRQTLTFFFEDRAHGRFPLRAGTIVPESRGFRFEPSPDDQLRVPGGD